MSINKNLAKTIQRYKLDRDLSISELAEELGVARSILESYLNGTGNPRADTLELLSEKSGIPLSEFVSGPPSGLEQAHIAVCAAREFASLPPERRELCISHFIELLHLMAQPDEN